LLDTWSQGRKGFDRVRIPNKIKRKKMTTTEKTSGKVIASLVKEYQAIIAGNENAIREFIRKAHKTPARDLAATIEEASKAGKISAIRPAYANYFGLANTCLSLEGADKVAVSDFMKEVAVAQRTLKKEGALELVARVKNFADFSAKAREAESKKKAGKPKTERKSSKAEAKVNADSVVAFALGSLQELAGEDAFIKAIPQAEKLLGVLDSLIKSSKGANHPAGKARKVA
jgi:hypothetical protein